MRAKEAVPFFPPRQGMREQGKSRKKKKAQKDVPLLRGGEAGSRACKRQRRCTRDERREAARSLPSARPALTEEEEGKNRHAGKKSREKVFILFFKRDKRGEQKRGKKKDIESIKRAGSAVLPACSQRGDVRQESTDESEREMRKCLPSKTKKSHKEVCRKRQKERGVRKEGK